jgi:hypothetical protein
MGCVWCTSAPLVESVKGRARITHCHNMWVEIGICARLSVAGGHNRHTFIGHSSRDGLGAHEKEVKNLFSAALSCALSTPSDAEINKKPRLFYPGTTAKYVGDELAFNNSLRDAKTRRIGRWVFYRPHFMRKKMLNGRKISFCLEIFRILKFNYAVLKL